MTKSTPQAQGQATPEEALKSIISACDGEGWTLEELRACVLSHAKAATGESQSNEVSSPAVPKNPLTEHNYVRLLVASLAIKPHLETDLLAHEPWKEEIDEFLSAIDALQVKLEVAQ